MRMGPMGNQVKKIRRTKFWSDVHVQVDVKGQLKFGF